MKQTLFILALISCQSVCAQRNKLDDTRENFFRFGAKAGVNANKISGASYKSGFNYNYQLGGFVQINFSRKLGLQPEINFLQASAEFSNDPADIYDDIFRDGSQKTSRLNYLEVPVLLNINIGPTKRVKLQVGPAYGGLLKQTVDSLRTNIGTVYKNADWSAIGGLWIQLPVVHFGARHKMGITNLNALDDRQNWRSQSVQVFLGVTF
jgi:hypothetical protein